MGILSAQGLVGRELIAEGIGGSWVEGNLGRECDRCQHGRPFIEDGRLPAIRLTRTGEKIATAAMVRLPDGRALARRGIRSLRMAASISSKTTARHPRRLCLVPAQTGSRRTRIDYVNYTTYRGFRQDCNRN
jgi:hypothetical protein